MAILSSCANDLREDFVRSAAALGRERNAVFLEAWINMLRDNFYLADNRIEESEIRNLVMDLLERPKPIYKLIDTVTEAIREYDRSNDHLKHGPGSDCIRCALETVIDNTFAGMPIRKTR
ncbi:MAG TPA: hypothetical protein VIE65_12360 [Methylobacter sp.]|jgi:hypothetical protein